MERLSCELERQVLIVESLKARHRREHALAEQLTAMKNRALADGRLAAIRLRCAIRSILGPRDERLTQFGIAPLRKRSRRTLHR